METSVYRTLNRKQFEAATEHLDSPLVIFAGPGSGKTLTLALRIVFLLNKGVLPSQILALTFTKRAALQMQSKLTRHLPKHTRADEVTITTFHKLGLRLLRANAAKAKLNYNFEIYSGNKQRTVLEAALNQYLSTHTLPELWEGREQPLTEDQLAFLDNSLSYKSPSLRRVAGVIARTKVDPEYKTQLSAGAQRLLGLYNALLRENNAIDLPDILHLTVKLLSEHNDVLTKQQERFRYIIVDEFQDTNAIQLQFLCLIGQHSYITVCGDDDQAIYGWRGAASGVFDDFRGAFAATKTVTLEANYRSTQHIVQLSQSLIQHNKHRMFKQIFTENKPGVKAELLIAQNPRAEARDVISLILHYKKAFGLSFSDIAVLYRLHKISKELLIELERLHVPFSVNKRKSPINFDHSARALLHYLKLALDPSDDCAFLEVCNCPKRGLGHQALAKVKGVASLKECSLLQACKFIVRSANGKRLTSYHELLNTMTYITAQLTQTGPFQLLNNLAQRFNFNSGVVSHLLRLAKPYTSPGTYQQFLSTFDDEIEVSANAISLSTIHQAKGQEWELVAVVGLCEGILPAASCEDLEEERRLAYVAFTRSKEFLILATHQTDSLGGLADPSRFIDELALESLSHASFKSQPSHTKVVPVP